MLYMGKALVMKCAASYSQTKVKAVLAINIAVKGILLTENY